MKIPSKFGPHSDRIYQQKITLGADLFLENGQPITDNKTIAEKVNNYFVNIRPSLAANISNSPIHFSSFLSVSYPNSLLLSPTDPLEIIRISHELKNKKSSGFDNIQVDIMKTTIESVANPLSIIINNSF